jgi:hypothetical protein
VLVRASISSRLTTGFAMVNGSMFEYSQTRAKVRPERSKAPSRG